MEKVEISPCPFCGGEAEVSQNVFGYSEEECVDVWHGDCPNCGAASPPSPDRSEAINTWNTRPREAALEAALTNALTFMEAFQSAFSSGGELPTYEQACDAANEIRAVLTAPAPEGLGEAWKPIETAPEMQHVMLWFPRGEHVIALMTKAGDYETVGYMGDDTPTHWQPLSPPPALSTHGDGT